MKVVHSLSWSLIALVSYCYNYDCGSARGGGGGAPLLTPPKRGGGGGGGGGGGALPYTTAQKGMGF